MPFARLGSLSHALACRWLNEEDEQYTVMATNAPAALWPVTLIKTSAISFPVAKHSNMQRNIRRFQENNVDFYINGHDHCLEHISSRDSPIQYFTSGGGSKAWRGIFQENEDQLEFFYDGQGFLSLELNENKARFAFYDVYGEALYHWSLSKANLLQVQASARVTEE
ncbi:hypothetical protein GUJ93_ZPchr0010g9008 [Zizania palustris]|uniref:Calcineurin-like phosphoesterase domain-containing protein n=1 Tax=Zizania palustris TaxID=103762 RepID=A0A8J5WGY2_ZIZPA|nr:hypothetical protein GUJ93_ZPchr0010g9008 [Zizania palustris]